MGPAGRVLAEEEEKERGGEEEARGGEHLSICVAVSGSLNCVSPSTSCCPLCLVIPRLILGGKREGE